MAISQRSPTKHILPDFGQFGCFPGKSLEDGIGQAVHEGLIAQVSQLRMDQLMRYGGPPPRGDTWAGVYLGDLLVTQKVKRKHMLSFFRDLICYRSAACWSPASSLAMHSFWATATGSWTQIRHPRLFFLPESGRASRWNWAVSPLFPVRRSAYKGSWRADADLNGQQIHLRRTHGCTHARGGGANSSQKQLIRHSKRKQKILLQLPTRYHHDNNMPTTTLI